MGIIMSSSIVDITSDTDSPTYRHYQCTKCSHKFYSDSHNNLYGGSKECGHPCPMCGDFKRGTTHEISKLQY